MKKSWLPFRGLVALLLGTGLLGLGEVQLLHPLHSQHGERNGEWVTVCSQDSAGRRVPHLEAIEEVWHASCPLCLQPHRSLAQPDLRAGLSLPVEAGSHFLPTIAPHSCRPALGCTQPRAPPLV